VDEPIRTAPPSAAAVTEWPRLRPSKISASIWCGLNAFSGAPADGAGVGTTT
jgi:hypothetical protein